MSGLTLLAPLGLVGLIAIPVIVLLYMRTTTPDERSVPSTRFWQGAESPPTDHHRFRFPPLSVLMLMHLMLAALLAFALAQPASASILSRFAGRADPHHLILIIDGSTSMGAATDPLGSVGRSHFDLARARASSLLGDLQEGDSATILLIGTHTSTWQASDLAEIAELTDTVGALALPGGEADLNGTLRLVRDLLVPGVRDEIVLITDGAVAVDPHLVAELHVPIQLEQASGSYGTGNIAITDIAATGSATSPGRQDVFVRVVNFSERRRDVPITIAADGIAIIERTLVIDPGSAATVTQLLPEGALIASAQIHGEDALVADNVAQIALAASGLSGIQVLLVSDQPSAILRALSAIPGSQVETRTRNQFLASGTPDGTDLIVVEGGVVSTTLPAIPVVLVNPGGGGGSMSFPQPIRIQSQDPIMTGVDLAGVTFGEVPIIPFASGDTEIVGAEGGPLIVRSETPAGQPEVILAFDIDQSNLPVRVAFPILIANIVDDLVDRGLPSSLAAGDPLVFTVGSTADHVLITGPDGLQHVVAPAQTGAAEGQTVTFGDTGQPGTYRIDVVGRDGGLDGQFVMNVNAGHPRESNLVPNKLLPDVLATSPSSDETSTARNLFDLWPIVLAAVLVLLILEWFFSLATGHRRTLFSAAAGEPR
jgi:hypothetical protein